MTAINPTTTQANLLIARRDLNQDKLNAGIAQIDTHLVATQADTAIVTNGNSTLAELRGVMARMLDREEKRLRRERALLKWIALRDVNGNGPA